MPGMAAWREIVQTRPITALFAGHTHYGQIANDGRHVYVATRSIGDPEGGPAGYAVVYLEGDDFALTYRSMEDRGPVALITHPRRLVLATNAAHIVTGPVEGCVRGWSAAPITAAKVRINDGPWAEMRATGDMTWSFPIPGDTLAKAEHTLEVSWTDANKARARIASLFCATAPDVTNPYPLCEPVVRETKFC